MATVVDRSRTSGRAPGNCSERITVTPADFEITSEDMPGWLVATEGRLTVALDITLTDCLRAEGVARELINRIQNIRKDSGFEVTDKIRVEIKDIDDRGKLSLAPVLDEVEAEDSAE